jgi:hypothetical protein
MVGEKRHQRLLYMKVEWRDAQRSPHTMYRYFGVGAPVFKLNRNRPGTNKKKSKDSTDQQEKKEGPWNERHPQRKKTGVFPNWLVDQLTHLFAHPLRCSDIL